MPRATRIEAGKLRHRISICDPDLSQDASGAVATDSGAPFADVWASIESLAGKELYTAQQTVSEVTHRIVIRWRRGIVARQFIRFAGRFFLIQAVSNPDEKKHLLALLCIERNDSARFSGGIAS